MSTTIVAAANVEQPWLNGGRGCSILCRRGLTLSNSNSSSSSRAFSNLVSRQVEARADIHSLELTGDLDTFVAVEKRLSTANLSDLAPSGLGYALFFTHPTGPERIALAREWQRLRAR